jgi:hypothetical protein
MCVEERDKQCLTADYAKSHALLCSVVLLTLRFWCWQSCCACRQAATATGGTGGSVQMLLDL